MLAGFRKASSAERSGSLNLPAQRCLSMASYRLLDQRIACKMIFYQYAGPAISSISMRRVSECFSGGKASSAVFA